MTTERDAQINELWEYIRELEERIKSLESITKDLRPE